MSSIKQCYIVGTLKDSPMSNEVILAQGEPGDEFVKVFDTIKNVDAYKDLRIVHGCIIESTMPERYGHTDTLKDSSRTWTVRINGSGR